MVASVAPFLKDSTLTIYVTVVQLPFTISVVIDSPFVKKTPHSMRRFLTIFNKYYAVAGTLDVPPSSSISAEGTAALFLLNLTLIL